MYFNILIAMLLGAVIRFWMFGNPAPAPDLANPKQYHAAGIQFSYPGNWKAEDKYREGNHCIEITDTRLSHVWIYPMHCTSDANLLSFAMADSVPESPFQDTGKSALFDTPHERNGWRIMPERIQDRSKFHRKYQRLYAYRPGSSPSYILAFRVEQARMDNSIKVFEHIVDTLSTDQR